MADIGVELLGLIAAISPFVGFPAIGGNKQAAIGNEIDFVGVVGRKIGPMDIGMHIVWWALGTTRRHVTKIPEIPVCFLRHGGPTVG